MEFKLERILGYGFFSDGFRLLESYMECKKNGVNFYLESSKWLFGHNIGWNDYFTTLTDKTDESLPNIEMGREYNKEFTVAQFRQAIQEVFVYQPYLIEKADSLITSKNYFECLNRFSVHFACLKFLRQHDIFLTFRCKKLSFPN